MQLPLPLELRTRARRASKQIPKGRRDPGEKLSILFVLFTFLSREPFGHQANHFISQEDQYLKRPEVKIPIPDALRVKLVDDWEAITKNSQVCRVGIYIPEQLLNPIIQLVTLPRDPDVKTITQMYKISYRMRKAEKKAT
jgi:hypothetical protein